MRIAIFAALLLATCASAYRITISGSVPTYVHDGYRPQPHYRVGVFDAHSKTAKGMGNKQTPMITVNLKVDKMPVDANGTVIRYVEVFAYSVEAVELGVLSQVKDAHVCMRDGEKRVGGALFQNMTKYAHKFPIDLAMDGSRGSIRGSWPILYTGLYVISINACIHDTVGSGENNTLQRVLRYPTGPSGSIHGTIEVANPYGELPGQAVGFIPSYACLFLFSVIGVVAMMVGVWQIGAQRVLVYQWFIIATLCVTALAYMVMISYIGALNETNSEATGAYVFARLLLAGRSTLSRVAIFLAVIGFGITRRTLSKRVIAGIIAGSSLHFFFQIVQLIVAQSTGQKDSSQVTVIHMQEPVTQVSTVFIVLIEIAFGILIAVCLQRFFKKLSEKDAAKMRAYRQMTVVLAVYAVLCVIFGVYVLAAFGPGSFNVRYWEFWWLAVTMWDFLYIFVIYCMAAVWFPRKSSAYLEVANYADGANYDEPGRPGTQPSHAAPRVQYGGEEEFEMTGANDAHRGAADAADANHAI
jgi:hypothetical protein